jgi:hypothetical protein
MNKKQLTEELVKIKSDPKKMMTFGALGCGVLFFLFLVFCTILGAIIGKPASAMNGKPGLVDTFHGGSRAEREEEAQKRAAQESWDKLRTKEGRREAEAYMKRCREISGLE